MFKLPMNNVVKLLEDDVLIRRRHANSTVTDSGRITMSVPTEYVVKALVQVYSRAARKVGVDGAYPTCDLTLHIRKEALSDVGLTVLNYDDRVIWNDEEYVLNKGYEGHSRITDVYKYYLSRSQEDDEVRI